MSSRIVLNKRDKTIKIVNRNNSVKLSQSKQTIKLEHSGKVGPAGPGDKNFEQSFTNQSTIIVDHNLDKFPAVTIKDSAGDEVEGSIEHITKNSIRLTFSSSFSGMVICN